MARRKAGTLKSKRDVEEKEEEVSTSASDVAEDEVESDDDDNNSEEEEKEEEDDVSDVQSEEEDDEEEMDNSSASSEDEHSGDDDDDDDDDESDDVNTDTLVQSEHCTFDLGNLLAFNTHQVNSAELYNSNKKKNSNNNSSSSNLNKEWYDTKSPTIEITNNALPVNESVLLAKAAEGTTQLLRELWKLPTEKTDLGLLAKLPTADTKLPRMLSPPPPKQLTKWEQFALQRGIAPKGKRSRKVYDEATGEWKHLTGSLDNKANAGPESWPILEVKKNDDPYQDPWEKLREEKKGRITKNTEARMRNAERSGSLEKGTANKMMKNVKKQEKQRELMRQKERASGLVAPVGVPVDMMKGGSDATRQQQRGKPSTQLALKATQVSTASLGRFDKQIEGEPERQLKKNVKRRKLDPTTTGNTNKKYLQTEVQKSQDILSRVMNGSTKEKERDVKKGRYAKGETAYDYDFDDGLGAGSFKKKKGRAGAGKMKKLTKARIK